MELERRDGWLHERYARWLDGCTRIAFVVTLGTFVAYVSGLLAPFVPLQALAEAWNLPLAQYLERTGSPTGWHWLSVAGYADYLNYVGICLFALVILICNIAMVIPMLRHGERLLALLASAQALVLLLAASGWFAGG